MKHVLILFIRFYRKFLSPLKSKPCCRFTPSCSAYAIEALQKRGFFVGTALSVYRIIRCNPFCAGGYDPVPLYGFRQKKGGTKSENPYDVGSDEERFVFKYDLELDESQKSPKK